MSTLALSVLQGFRARSPWAAALVAALLSPVAGFLFLGCGWWSVAYGVAWFMPAWVAGAASYFGWTALEGETASVVFLAAIVVLGTCHCYVAAKRWPRDGKRAWYSRWYVLTPVFVVFLIAAPIFKALVYGYYAIPSRSMVPTIEKGDRVIVAMFAYGYTHHHLPGRIPGVAFGFLLQEPRRGDVVVYKLSTDNPTDYIGRIVGLPGDVIQLRDSVLFINRQPEPRFPDGWVPTDDPKGAPLRRYTEVFPEGSRHQIAEVTENSPYDTTPEFVVPAGGYFMLGDNRDRSRDSRFSNEHGPVPRADILGKAVLILWNDEEDWFKYVPIR
ncbi:MAG: signal peptidase I [Rhodospirillales bacterium]|nr:signal peptidase I [Rhodospirillales bacterium]